MKVVEVRRHSIRGSDDTLSEEGRQLARRAGSTLEGKYLYCYTSPKKRAIQTLEEFGYTIFKVDERFGPLPGDKVRPFEDSAKKIVENQKLSLLQAFFEIRELHPIMEEKGRELIEAVKRTCRELPDDGRALAISHGGSIEPAAILALGKDFSLDVLGGELLECEGVRFFVEGDSVKRIDVIRLVK